MVNFAPSCKFSSTDYMFKNFYSPKRSFFFKQDFENASDVVFNKEHLDDDIPDFGRMGLN